MQVILERKDQTKTGRRYIELGVEFSEQERKAITSHHLEGETFCRVWRQQDDENGMPIGDGTWGVVTVHDVMGRRIFDPYDQNDAGFSAVENELRGFARKLQARIDGLTVPSPKVDRPVVAAPTARAATSQPRNTAASPPVDIRERRMRVTIERKPRMYTTWFGLGSQKQSGTNIEVSLVLTEVDKEIIKRAALGSHVVYEYPIDQEDYAQWQAAREKWLREGQGAGGYLGSCKTYPNAKPSLLVANFLQAPTPPQWSGVWIKPRRQRLFQRTEKFRSQRRNLSVFERDEILKTRRARLKIPGHHRIYNPFSVALLAAAYFGLKI